MQLDDAIGGLADLFDFGRLKLSNDPAGFLSEVIAEIKRLRLLEQQLQNCYPELEYD